MVRCNLAILDNLSSILLVICYMLTIKVDEPLFLFNNNTKRSEMHPERKYNTGLWMNKERGWGMGKREK
jgi:hypothetical protein